MAPHLPVMRDAVLRALAPRPGDTVVDGTLGTGGHAEALLDRIAPGGMLIGIDRDASMLARAAERLARFGSAFRAVHTRLAFLADAARGAGLAAVDAILLDLGLCSAQLDDPKRGFSFRPEARSAPLDMRMDQSRGETAAQLLDRVDEDELAALLRRGGVPASRRTARAILERRPVRTVGDLLDALRDRAAPGGAARRHHPATLVFQALRIAVNGELEDLEAALEAGVELLAPGGRLAVLAYHSGEDRRVKTLLAREAKGCICPPALPVCGCGRTPRLVLGARGEGPGRAEVEANPRARSARLRSARRL